MIVRNQLALSSSQSAGLKEMKLWPRKLLAGTTIAAEKPRRAKGVRAQSRGQSAGSTLMSQMKSKARRGKRSSFRYAFGAYEAIKTI